MADLHETDEPEYTAQIDTVGWIFVAVAVAITVIAAVVAYHGSGTMIANTPVPHVTGSPG
jgi:hypothetical protein